MCNKIVIYISNVLCEKYTYSVGYDFQNVRFHCKFLDVYRKKKKKELFGIIGHESKLVFFVHDTTLYQNVSSNKIFLSLSGKEGEHTNRGKKIRPNKGRKTLFAARSSSNLCRDVEIPAIKNWYTCIKKNIYCEYSVYRIISTFC